jgi:dATP pyrophosphohydrolase
MTRVSEPVRRTPTEVASTETKIHKTEHMKTRNDMITCYVARKSAATGAYEFLQLRRAPGDYMGGTWAAISGCIEPGETAWHAALRELREEAGLTPTDFYRLAIVNSFYIASHDTLWHAILFLAIVDADADVVLNEENDAVRWTPRSRADEQFMWPTDRAAIAEICRDILDDGQARPYLRIPLDGSNWPDEPRK